MVHDNEQSKRLMSAVLFYTDHENLKCYIKIKTIKAYCIIKHFGIV